jgi:hypothetical protein
MESKTAPATPLVVEVMSTDQLKEAWLRSDAIEFGDPVLAHVSFPHRKTYFPLGFSVTITTNSPEVLEAAEQSWGRFTHLFDRPPIHLQIGMSEGESCACPLTPVCRMRDHIVSNIADGENFAICDLSRGSAMIWVTRAAMQHCDYFRYFFLESSAMCNISGRYATGIHAACVALNGNGILLCGDSGAGKSTLSYACAQAGWTYVTDDGSYLIHDRADRLVVGNYRQIRLRPTAEVLFPELCGLAAMQRAGVGKPSVELFTNPGTIASTAGTAHVKHIVFLKRDVAVQELAIFPRAVARLYMQQSVYCLPYDSEPHMAAIDQLLELETYELRYNDLDWAIKRLALLVQEGRP